MVRKFRVLQNTYGKMSIYVGRLLMTKGEIVEVKVLENGIYIYDNWRFHPSWFSEWVRLGYLEEITEENTNNQDDIYSKKYNIYEILTLIPNLPKDIKFKCSLDEITWYISEDENTLISWDDDIKKYNSLNIEEFYSLKEILEATYTIIKPQEEKVEKWIKIISQADLCNAIVNKKMIRFGKWKPKNEYNNEQIETLFGALEDGVFKIEYLEE